MFIKYPSLENWHNVNETMHMEDPRVVVYEKIDGSNTSVIVLPDGTYRYASRNQLVDNKWNGVEDVMDKDLLRYLQNYCITNCVQVNLYGEIFSSKILRRFNYGSTRIRFFDGVVDGKFLTQKDFLKLMYGMENHIAHIITVSPLWEAVEMDVEAIKSTYAGDSAVAEGIVLKGYSEPIKDKYGKPIIIKKKSQRFLEKSNNVKEPKTPEKLTDLQLDALGYVNESRVFSAESKLGEFDIRRTGEFLKEISTDVFNDIMKDKPGINKKDFSSKVLQEKIKTTLFKTYGVIK